MVGIIFTPTETLGASSEHTFRLFLSHSKTKEADVHWNVP